MSRPTKTSATTSGSPVDGQHSARSSPARAATSSASLVLPMPGGPDNNSHRVEPLETSARTPATMLFGRRVRRAARRRPAPSQRRVPSASPPRPLPSTRDASATRRAPAPAEGWRPASRAVRRRRQAELVVEHPGTSRVRIERVRRAARPVQREHVQPAAAVRRPPAPRCQPTRRARPAAAPATDNAPEDPSGLLGLPVLVHRVVQVLQGLTVLGEVSALLSLLHRVQRRLNLL
jgi:hypothetical protein